MESVTKQKVVMRSRVELEIGSKLHFPYSIEVAAGEPSEWGKVHKRYAKQDCTVVGIDTQPPAFTGMSDDVTLKVRFSDGFETEAWPPAFIYIGPPEEKV